MFRVNGLFQAEPLGDRPGGRGPVRVEVRYQGFVQIEEDGLRHADRAGHPSLAECARVCSMPSDALVERRANSDASSCLDRMCRSSARSLLSDGAEVIVGIMDRVGSGFSRTDHYERRRLFGLVLQMVRVRTTGRKTCEGAFFQRVLAVVVYERELAAQNVDELVFGFVPMP